MFQDEDYVIQSYVKMFYLQENAGKFYDLHRALYYELLAGPMPDGYWNETDILDNYEWKDYMTALSDFSELLYSIPEFLWVDDNGTVYEKNPQFENMKENWEGDFYIGPEYSLMNVLECILSEEVLRIHNNYLGSLS